LVSYVFCPIEKYTGQLGDGKTSKIIAPHLIISFAIAVFCFLFIADISIVDKLFEDNFIRIGSFMLLWLVWVFLLGLLIEAFLVKTDKEYNNWKRGPKK
jgi:hypothetical protein